MATLTATNAADAHPVHGTGPAGNLKVAYGQYSFTDAGVAVNDVIEMCKVPAGAVVLGGYVMAGDLDTGAEALDIDVGWAATDDEVADPDGFGNFGVWTGDVVANMMPVAGIWKPLQGVLLTDGPKTFSAEATIELVVNADATTPASAEITLVVFYVYNV